MEFQSVYDISVILGVESITYPEDEPYRKEVMKTIEKGVELSRLVMSSHAGTHIDVPAHFVKYGKRIHEYDAEKFIVPAQVIGIENPAEITVEELRDLPLKEEKALLFKTRNSRDGISNNGKFTENFVYLTEEAADYCVKRKIPLVGIDYITVEKFDNKNHMVHKKLLGNGILILEGINLKNVPIGDYTLICLPLRIKDGEASPVRAILVK